MDSKEWLGGSWLGSLLVEGGRICEDSGNAIAVHLGSQWSLMTACTKLLDDIHMTEHFVVISSFQKHPA